MSPFKILKRQKGQPLTIEDRWFLFIASLIILPILSLFIMWLSPSSFQSTDDQVSLHIEKLKEVSENLENLEALTDEKERNIKNEIRYLQELREAKDTLIALIENDQKVIETVFVEQEKRQKKAIWIERMISFFTGILTSIVASLIYDSFKRKKLKKNIPS